MPAVDKICQRKIKKTFQENNFFPLRFCFFFYIISLGIGNTKKENSLGISCLLMKVFKQQSK